MISSTKTEDEHRSRRRIPAGKPMDEAYAEVYRQLLVDVINRPEIPIVFNLNIGHAMPRCFIPFGVHAVVDAEKQIIRFTE